MLGLLSPGNAEANVGCGENLNNESQLYLKYFCQKLLKSANIFFELQSIMS